MRPSRQQRKNRAAFNGAIGALNLANSAVAIACGRWGWAAFFGLFAAFGIFLTVGYFLWGRDE